MEEGIRARLTAGEGRRFGLTVGAAFCALGALLVWRGRAPAGGVAATAGMLLLLGGLLVPGRLGPIHNAWMGFARALSKVTTPIFMGIVYFIVFAPVGLVMRAGGRNPLAPPGQAGVWIKRDPSRRGDMHRQF